MTPVQIALVALGLATFCVAAFYFLLAILRGDRRQAEVDELKREVRQLRREVAELQERLGDP